MEILNCTFMNSTAKTEGGLIYGFVYSSITNILIKDVIL